MKISKGFAGLSLAVAGTLVWIAGCTGRNAEPMRFRVADAVVVAPDDYFGEDRMGSIVHWGGGAAKDLTNALSKVVGRTIALYPESKAPVGAKSVIYLGDVRAAHEAGVADNGLRRLDFRVKTLPGKLFIWAKTGTGASYGVTDFLARFCGYRFLVTTGDDPYEVKRDLSIPDCDYVEKAAIYRHCIGQGRGPGPVRPKTQRLLPGDRSGIARRLRLAVREQDIEGEMQISSQTRVKCHSSFSYLPPKDYWKDHPEYYSMNEAGRRYCLPDARIANGQLCYTNPEVRRLCTEALLGFIAKDRAESPENPPCVYDFTQQDAMGFLCLCPECRKVIAKYNRKPGGHAEGGDAGLQLEFINAIAREVAKRYPDVFIRTFAYVSTEVPPGGLVPERNVVIWLCDLYTRCNHMLPLSHPFNAPRKKLIEDWAKITPNIEMWDYMLYDKEYSRGRIFPEVSVDAIASDAKFFRDLGIQRVYMESEYANQPFWELNAYAMGQFYWNPDRDLDGVIDEFCAVYGKGAGKMREAIDLLRRTILANPPKEWQARIMSWRNAEFYETFRRPVAAAYALEDDPAKRSRIAKVLAYVDDELAHLRGGTPAERTKAKADAANWLKFTIEDVSSEYDDPAERAKAAESVRNEVRKQKAMDDLRFADLPSAVADAAEGDLFCADHRRAHAQQKSAHFVDDAKSPAGRAIELEPEAAQSPMTCGLTDSATWRMEKMPLDLSSVPDDGTYRWYRVGAARLRRYGFFYFPASIHCRFDLDFAFVNDDGLPADFNRFDCWLSVARANGRIRVDRLAIRRVPGK